MTDQPKQDPTYPDAKIILIDKKQAKFTCPLPTGDMGWLLGPWGPDTTLYNEGTSFVLQVDESGLGSTSWPWHICQNIWQLLADRGHVQEKFPGIVTA